MNQKGTAIRATVYIQADDAEKVRAYARQACVSERRAIRILITAGLSFLDDRDAISDRLARFHREFRVRDHELLAMMVELVLGIRFLAESHTEGMEKKLRQWSKDAMASLNSKIEQNDKGKAE
jgi:hypothetical protein